MDSGNLSLQKSLSAFEEGVVLTRFCQEILNDTETKIKTWQKEA